MSARRTIIQLPRDIQRQTGAIVAYRRIWGAAVDGRIQVEQESNGRWTYDPADVLRIAVALGLKPAPSAVAA